MASTGSWTLPFYMVAALGVVCSLLFMFFVTTDPIEIPGLAGEADHKAAD